MRRIPVFGILGVLAVMAGSILTDIPAADARSGNARWCAVVSVGYDDVQEICEFATIEACRPHVLAGNRGVCNENPGYIEPAVRHVRKKRPIKG